LEHGNPFLCNHGFSRQIVGIEMCTFSKDLPNCYNVFELELHINKHLLLDLQSSKQQDLVIEVKR
jgi:hypothetical protein